MPGRLTCLHAEPVPTVVAGPADWEEPPSGDTTRLREHIERAAAELAAAMSSDRR
jgi:FMN reductase